MRITILLLLGIAISLTTALSPTTLKTAVGSDASKEKVAHKKLAANTTTTTSPKHSAKPAKSEHVKAKATADKDKRGKRTLYDFGNAGYLYPQIASRRAGYDTVGQSYYPQQGYYNGQDAVAQFPNNYAGPQYYPQYLEAPEPIIEIIIKDSNETLPEAEPPQPIVTKKKKEKVHVFYVNYKKDQNNKLHLESPIASLNNDDNEEEEEEEVVHYPSPATPAPPVKSTTLRTIIHPDSEKYHSNSGIHVTFGSEDKAQEGHQIEESDAESIQNQVVAIPVGGSAPGGASYKANEYNMRADFGASGQGQSSYQQTQFGQQQQQFQAQYQRQQLPHQQNANYFRPPAALVQPAAPSFYQKQQQTQYQQQQQQQTQHSQQQQTQQQHHSQQQQQQQTLHAAQQHSAQPQQPRPQFNTAFNSVAGAPPTLPAPYSLPFLQQLTQFRKTFGAANAAQGSYFFNHNQQYQSQPSNQQQSFLNNNVVPKVTPAPPKQPTFFPTEPPRSHQELPVRQAGPPYQPVKFRPTVASAQPHIKQVSIPTKLENANYQQQQHYQQQQQQQQQYQHTQPAVKPQQQSYQPLQFNRQPQFVNKPTFSVTSPQLGSTVGTTGSANNNYFKQAQQTHSHTQLLSQKLASSRYQLQPQTQPQQQSPHHYQSHFSQQQQSQTQPQQHATQQQSYQAQQKLQQSAKQTYSNQQHNAPTAAALQSPVDPIKTLHNYFGAQSSKETELLKAIPKYEQHITETIETPVSGGGGGASGHYNDFGSFGYQAQNQVLHDIPAPNLGPTAAPSLNQQTYRQQQQQTQNQASSNYASGNADSSNGHYITAAALQTQRQHQQQQQQQQFSNFVTVHSNQPSAYPTTTAAPPQYAQTTDGEKVMIITPMPPNAYNQYHSSQYQQQASGVQQVHASSSSQPTGHFPVQQPRQSAGSLISATVPNTGAGSSAQFSVSNYHSDVFKELEQRRTNAATPNEKPYLPATQSSVNSYASQASESSSSTKQESASPQSSTNTDTEKDTKATQTLLQLPDEVPDDLRQQLLSSGILNNADISILDYDKVGDVALENLPAEHLQHFYGAGGAAQISASKKVLAVVKPNGDKVALSEKEIERVKQSNSLPHKQGVDVKVVRFNAENEKSISAKYIKSDATVVPPVDLAERQYNRYLPLKINGAQFPLPESDELKGKKVVSVVVLAPVEAQPPTNAPTSSSNERRSERETTDVDNKEVKFVGGDLIKTLVKKPTKENFKRWLEKEAHTDVEQQSVILLVAKTNDEAEQEIFMYDISTGAVNKLNGELSSAFVNVAEENASSEDLEHASTLDPSVLETMMQKSRRR